MTVLNDFHKFRLKPIGMPPPTLVSDFGRLINNPELADVRFVVEGKDVFAHRAVLACRSEYFRVLLTGGMRESLTQSEANVAAGMLNLGGGQDAPIHIQDVSHTVFLQVLEFLYTDSVSNMTLDTGIHLMIASEQFMLDRLKSLCEDVIRRDIDLDNCIGILVASHRHHASNLKEIALEFIMRNLSHGTIRNALTVSIALQVQSHELLHESQYHLIFSYSLKHSSQELKPEPDLLVEILQRTTAADSLAAQVVGERNLDTRPGHFGAGAGWSNNARR